MLNVGTEIPIFNIKEHQTQILLIVKCRNHGSIFNNKKTADDFRPSTVHFYRNYAKITSSNIIFSAIRRTSVM